MKHFLLFMFATYSLSLIPAESQSSLNKKELMRIFYQLANHENDEGIYHPYFLLLAHNNEELANDYDDLYYHKLTLKDFYRKWNITQKELQKK